MTRRPSTTWQTHNRRDLQGFAGISVAFTYGSIWTHGDGVDFLFCCIFL